VYGGAVSNSKIGKDNKKSTHKLKIITNLYKTGLKKKGLYLADGYHGTV
jgi:hypothetical protein